jgi:hypothetical protein
MEGVEKRQEHGEDWERIERMGAMDRSWEEVENRVLRFEPVSPRSPSPVETLLTYPSDSYTTLIVAIWAVVQLTRGRYSTTACAAARGLTFGSARSANSLRRLLTPFRRTDSASRFSSPISFSPTALSASSRVNRSSSSGHSSRWPSSISVYSSPRTF